MRDGQGIGPDILDNHHLIPVGCAPAAAAGGPDGKPECRLRIFLREAEGGTEDELLALLVYQQDGGLCCPAGLGHQGHEPL